MRYSTKNFLSSSPDESGSLICKVETSLASDISDWTIRNGGQINGSVRVADCSQYVILDFDAVGQKSYEKRLSKLDKMIEDLQAMRHQYVAMWENHLRDINWKKVKDSKDAA